MRETMGCEVLAIGVGNPFRRDDGAGVEVVRRLKKSGIVGFEIMEQSGEGTALMDAWRKFKRVILVDAVSSGSPPGTVHILDPREKRIPSDFFHYSTHAFSVAEAVEMARALGRLPDRMRIYGIEGGDFDSGEGFSPAVERGIQQAVRLIEEFLVQMERESSEEEEFTDA